MKSKGKQMLDIKAGSQVIINNIGSSYSTYSDWIAEVKPKAPWAKGKYPIVGDTYTVEVIAPHRHPSNPPIAYCVHNGTGLGYMVGVNYHYVEVVPEVNPSKRGCPLGSTNRQFDVPFKQSVVRAAKATRLQKRHGGIKIILDMHGITSAHLTYWTRQHDEGHFSAERAVAFSRKLTMIHG
jgi:hypothetical protein